MVAGEVAGLVASWVAGEKNPARHGGRRLPATVAWRSAGCRFCCRRGDEAPEAGHEAALVLTLAGALACQRGRSVGALTLLVRSLARDVLEPETAGRLLRGPERHRGRGRGGRQA
jgi:hypothetical protein